MSKLNYKRIYDDDYINTLELYYVQSMYSHSSFKEAFLRLRASVADINESLVTKCIQGTEQDFIMLMNKAKDFLNANPVKDKNGNSSEAGNVVLLDLFRDCIFGYYILTPLIKAKDVSDIKVLAWNKITCKATGERYLTNLSFASEDDFTKWYDRILRIHRFTRSIYEPLLHCTDRKGVDDFYLRVDLQLKNVTSYEFDNIHIRKMPKVKYTWDYLFDNRMLDLDMKNYLIDRIRAGYGFLISGRGGSGKSTLLNLMLDEVPFWESGLVVQESDELYTRVHPQLQFEHTLELNKDGEGIQVSLEDLLRLGLLQDIDNFIIGEIKGGEALYVFTTAMSTGARFFGTIHSNDAKGSVARLAHCARYISDYPMEALEEMLTSTPFCLIHMSHFAIDEILEVSGWDNENNRLIFDEVYKKSFKER